MNDSVLESKVFDIVQRLKTVYYEIESIETSGYVTLDNVKHDAMEGLKEAIYNLLIMVSDDTLESLNRLVVENGLECISGMLIDLSI